MKKTPCVFHHSPPDELQKICKSAVKFFESTIATDLNYVPAKKDNKFTVEAQSFADIEEKPVEWLWQDIFARGMLNSIQGMPGIGKSFLLCAIAAAISSGTTLPRVGDISPEFPVKGKVLYLSGDDDYSKTIKPRLRMCGANMANIFTIKGDILPATDSDELSTAFELVKPDLVILDTLQHFLSGKTDMNAANNTTEKLSPLKALAERYNAAVVVIQHISKQATRGSGGSAVTHAIGSLAISGLFRSVWSLGRLNDNEGNQTDTRALCIAKGNLVVGDPESVLFTLTKKDGFQWAGTDRELRAEDLSSQPTRERGRPSDKRDNTADEIISFLKNKPDSKCLSSELKSFCFQNLNVGERTYQRAKIDAGIISKNENGNYYSMLPN